MAPRSGDHQSPSPSYRVPIRDFPYRIDLHQRFIRSRGLELNRSGPGYEFGTAPCITVPRRPLDHNRKHCRKYSDSLRL